MRLPLHYALLWDLEEGTPRPEGFAFLDRVVEWCERHRLWLFFDLHCAPGGQNAGNISDSDGVARLYTDPANQDAGRLSTSASSTASTSTGTPRTRPRSGRIYFNGKGPRPTRDEAAAAVRAMLQAASVSRCKRNEEVIRILTSS